jgi:hypothetical protein
LWPLRRRQLFSAASASLKIMASAVLFERHPLERTVRWRTDAGWACKVVPDERSALESEIARLQSDNATLKKDLLARGLPVPGGPGPSSAKPGEPELKLPSDAEVDKVISFLEKVWRRLIEMGRSVQRDVEKKN